ncbi:MAG: ABC transporter permease [Chloroflexota bacterium]
MRLFRGGLTAVVRVHGALAGMATRSQTLSLAGWADRSEHGWLVPPARALACSRALRLGIVLVLAVALFGLLVPFFTPYPPDQLIPGGRLQAPSLVHPLGTDALGRDMLSRVAFGSHLAARMALFSVGLSLSVGLLLGSVAGYYGGWLDQFISRAMDGWLALPGALVAIVIVARLGASFENLVLALGLMGVPSFYRIVRSSTLSARRLPFVEAAIAVGASDHRVMWRHVFPNILPPVVVLVTLHMGTAILTGSSLSFIGLGAQPPLPEWGALLAAGRTHFETAWWLAVFPGAAVATTVIGLNLLGDGLRDVLDPRFASEAGWRQGQDSSSSAADEAPRYRDDRPGISAPALAVLGSERKV